MKILLRGVFCARSQGCFLLFCKACGLSSESNSSLILEVGLEGDKILLVGVLGKGENLFVNEVTKGILKFGGKFCFFLFLFSNCYASGWAIEFGTGISRSNRFKRYFNQNLTRCKIISRYWKARIIKENPELHYI